MTVHIQIMAMLAKCGSADRLWLVRQLAPVEQAVLRRLLESIDTPYDTDCAQRLASALMREPVWLQEIMIDTMPSVMREAVTEELRVAGKYSAPVNDFGNHATRLTPAMRQAVQAAIELLKKETADISTNCAAPLSTASSFERLLTFARVGR